MSFRTRIVLMTITLVLALFSIGSTILIHITFDMSMKKEAEASVKENEMLLNTIKMVEEHGAWFTEYDLIAIVNKACDENERNSYRLTQDENNIYIKNKEIVSGFNQTSTPERQKVTVTYFQTESGEQYIQTTIRFYLNGKKYSLDIGRNLSAIYQMRENQINIFQKMFFVLLIVGSVLSWGLAGVLTKPLRKLTKATSEIGAGNFSYRTQIKSDDEIGALSQKFDDMAEQIEDNIALIKEAAERQEMFIGAFTHEMKTPMTSIIGYADLLRTQSISEEDKKEALNYIFTEAKRLENLSLKMLDLFGVDKKELVLKESSPSYLTNHVVDHLKNKYGNEGVKIEVQAEDGTCFLEPDLFQSLLIINLLENAKRAIQEEGMIFVSVEITETGCRMTIKDTGEGIPEESLLHLTEAFYRVDKARARGSGNIGLGLALCKKIVQLHNGEIEFTSKEGAGTKVTVSLNGGRHEKH